MYRVIACPELASGQLEFWQERNLLLQFLNKNIPKVSFTMLMTSSLRDA
tara:strand:+ start:207 stop:353 length:147 start_codon:yes stop_codon:yes gene_type:complete